MYNLVVLNCLSFFQLVLTSHHFFRNNKTITMSFILEKKIAELAVKRAARLARTVAETHIDSITKTTNLQLLLLTMVPKQSSLAPSNMRFPMIKL